MMGRLASQFAEALACAVILLLSVFTLRRLVLIAAAALPARGSTGGYLPSVAIIVAVRNEEVDLPGLLTALDRLKYVEDKLHFVIANDGSRDATAGILAAWAASQPRARIVDLPESIGKAAALNHALAAAPETDVIAVYDADLRPHPESLVRLAALFRDPRVAAAGGYRRPSNAGSNAITAYGALESVVHQMVTQAGKERLGLNPTTLGGNCLYRRSALLAAGGFPPGSFSEDIEVSLALVAGGWRTRFCRNAVSDCAMVESMARYWNQRARWTRGLYRSTRKASRIESWLVSAGYSDRIVLVAALGLAATGHLAPAWLALYFVAPAAAVVTGLARSGAGAKVAAKILLWAAPMFAVDIAATLAASVNTLLGRRLVWRTGRTQECHLLGGPRMNANERE
jgi:cellulose synthase/poly-beta-1,6-N-acetylglucosamine synthase-like glycosyltransferase